MRAIAAQFARFGVVGFGGLVIDVVLFNLLRATVLSPEVVVEGPVVAKIISVSGAILANWMGNRYWAFRHPGPSDSAAADVAREALAFAIVSLGGMAIALGCLFTSHYLLGFTSLAADNIASNVVGLALGTAFRFVFYRSWVFAPRGATIDRGSGTPKSAIRPSGFAPLRRLQAIAPIDDRSPAHE